MKSIDDIVKELYPPKNEQIEPSVAIFSDGYCYFKSNVLESIMEWSKDLGEKRTNRFNAWEEQFHPNLIWFNKNRLYLPKDINPSLKVFSICKGKKEQIRLSKLNLALLIFFVNHNLALDSSDLLKAKDEIQSINLILGNEISKQLDKKDVDIYKENDWFSKLVNKLNENDWEKDDKKHHFPDYYSIHICTRKEAKELNRSIEHDYELVMPYEDIIRDVDEYNNYIKELKRRTPIIEEEINRINPIIQAEEEAIERIKHNGSIDAAIELGRMYASRASQPPSEFEQWWRNDNLARLFISYDAKKYYYVKNGEKEAIKLPPRELAILFLFAKHLKEGLHLSEIRNDNDIYSELSIIYSRIKKKDCQVNLIPDDSKQRPNGVLLDLISRINKRFGYPMISQNNGVYSLSGVHDIIEF